MASLRARLMRRITSRYFRSVDARRADVPATRRKWDALAKFLPAVRGVASRRTTIAGLPALSLEPGDAPADKLLLYFHGGAYLMGSAATHRQMVSRVARDARSRALLPDYRLAPEHRFPAAVDDAVRIYRQLLDDGFAPGDIAVGGDSAGGGLTMAMLLTLRDTGTALPAFALLLSPWLDLTGSGESMRTRAERDPWFRPADLDAVVGYYCDDEQRAEPRVSPVFGEFGGLPPVYVQVGDDEILLSDSTRLAAGIEAAGGEVELEIWPEMWHVFQLFAGLMPEARQAVGRLGRHLGAALGTRVAASSSVP